MSDHNSPEITPAQGVLGGLRRCPTCRATPEMYGMPCDDPWHLEHPRTTVYLGTPKTADDPFKKLVEQESPASWYSLFWEVAFILKCLPSCIPSGNVHVLKKAREVTKCYEDHHTEPPKEIR